MITRRYEINGGAVMIVRFSFRLNACFVPPQHVSDDDEQTDATDDDEQSAVKVSTIMRVIQGWIMVLWVIVALSFLDPKALANLAQEMTHPVPLSTAVTSLAVVALLPVVSMQVAQALLMTLWLNIVSQFVDVRGLVLRVWDMTKPLPLKTLTMALVVFAAIPFLSGPMMQALVMIVWFKTVTSFVDLRTLLQSLEGTGLSDGSVLETQSTVEMSKKSNGKATTNGLSDMAVEGEEDATTVTKEDDSVATDHRTDVGSPVSRPTGMAFTSIFAKTPGTTTASTDAAYAPAMVTPGSFDSSSSARLVYQCPVENCDYQVSFPNKGIATTTGDVVSDEQRWGKAYKNQAQKMRSHYGKNHPEIPRSEYPEGFAYGKSGLKRSADNDDEDEAPPSKQARVTTDNKKSSSTHMVDSDIHEQSPKRARRS